MGELLLYCLIGFGCAAGGFCLSALLSCDRIKGAFGALESYKDKDKEKEEKILALLAWVNGEIEKGNFSQYTCRHAWRDCLEWSAGLIQDENFIIYRLMNKKHRKPKAEVNHD